MFNTIKNSMMYHNPDSYDLISENLEMDEVRNAFLDDPDSMSIGAENDPEIQKFIESIPVDDDDVSISEEELDKLAEGCHYGSESDGSIYDRISSGNYNEFDDEIPDAPMDDPDIDDYAYFDESDDNMCDKITSEGYSEFDDEIMGGVTSYSDSSVCESYSEFDDEILCESKEKYRAHNEYDRIRNKSINSGDLRKAIEYEKKAIHAENAGKNQEAIKYYNQVISSITKYRDSVIKDIPNDDPYDKFQLPTRYIAEPDGTKRTAESDCNTTIAYYEAKIARLSGKKVLTVGKNFTITVLYDRYKDGI